MKSDRIALFVALSAIAFASLSPLGAFGCATADLIEAPPYDSGPASVVSESGTDAPSSSDAGDAGDAGDAADATDARTDAGTTDASADAPAQG